MNKKYTTLYLDVDNTLLDFSLCETVSITRTFKELGLPYSDENVKLYKKINDDCWKELEKGLLTNSEVYTVRFERYLKEIGKTFDIKTINEKYFSYLSNCAYKLDGCDEVLDYLHKKYTVYIVTNGAARNQHSRIRISGIINKIDGLFISEEIGFKKPQKEFFDAVLSKTDEKDKSKILIVGDSLSSDIKGGINSGIDTCYVNINGVEPNIECTYTVNNLYELKEIL